MGGTRPFRSIVFLESSRSTIEVSGRRSTRHGQNYKYKSLNAAVVCTEIYTLASSRSHAPARHAHPYNFLPFITVTDWLINYICKHKERLMLQIENFETRG